MSWNARTIRFTPGPWTPHTSKRGGREGGTWWITHEAGASGGYIADCTGDNQQANALLIAAAPTMYAALVVTLGTMRRQLDEKGYAPDAWGDDEHYMLRAVEAAIKLADTGTGTDADAGTDG